MFYYFYEIKNKINGKIYVGVHKTKNMNDGYMGSGKVIQDAIKKHGIENFTKVILEMFDNSNDMFLKETEIVTDEFLTRDDVYNLRRGGSGGFDYINAHGLNINLYERTDEWRANLSRRMSENNPSTRPEVKIKNGARVKKMIESGRHPFGDSEKQRELSNRPRKDGRTKSEVSKETASRMVEDGTHSFLKMNADKIPCEHCGKIASYPNYKRWHGTKCRANIKGINFGVNVD